MIDPGKQSRLASGVPVVPAFDGYRAYAILAIVALHLVFYSGLLAARGPDWSYRLVQATLGQAIDVLFIISGFVVFLPTVARGGRFGSVRSYAMRRAARLVPAYWATSILVLALITVVSVHPPIDFPSAGDITIHAAFLQTPVQMFDFVPTGFGVNGVVWTLSLEVTFYLLLPMVAGWYFRHPLVGLAVAAALTAAWHEAFLHFGSVTDFLGVNPAPATSVRLQVNALSQFPFYAFSFAAGMTGAWAYVRARERRSDEVARRAAYVQGVSLAALLLFGYLLAAGDGVLLGPEAARRSPVIAIGFSGSLAALMVSTALGPATLQRLFSNPPARWLGDISYGIFLVHLVVITYAVRALGAVGPGPLGESVGTQGLPVTGDGTIREFLVLTAIVVPLSLAYGWASARFLEQPIRRWARRYGRRRERAPA